MYQGRATNHRQKNASFEAALLNYYYPKKNCSASDCPIWPFQFPTHTIKHRINILGMRKLKHHESKLLKKVDFLHWKAEDNLREVKLLRRYHIQKREDYIAYNRLSGMITKLTAKLATLPAANETRVRTTEALLTRLFNMGLIDTASSLVKAAALPATAFARRRLPVVMVRLRMADTLKAAVTFVEQGQVRVGPETVNDPAFIVTRTQEDFVTWVDSSRIKRAAEKYNDKLDDYDLLEGA
jgi:U3 small nucleolar ribonucleoprotein protein IMP3